MKILIIVLSSFIFTCYLSPASALSKEVPSASLRPVVNTSTTAAGAQHYIVSLQKQLKEKMVSLTRKLRQGDKVVALLLLGVAFLYGVVHSLGPGHGKAVIASYLLARKGSARQGVILAAIAGVVHGVSAIVLVLVIYFLSIGRLTTTFSHWSNNLQIVSYTVITLIGLWLLLAKLASLVQKKRGDTGKTESAGRPWWLLLALALAPCPGTMIVLLFFLSQKMLSLGILMALAVALGMALTLSGIAFFTVYMRATIMQRSSKTTRVYTVLHDLFGLLGALAVFCVGLLLLYGAIGG